MVRLQDGRVKWSVGGKIATVILLILVILFGRAAWNVYTKSRLTAAGREGAENRLAEIEKRKSTLLGDVARLSSGRGIEEEVRKNLSVIKTGEKVISLVDDEEKATTSTTTSWWKRWFGK